jgi:hypothetical protein
MQLLRLEVLAAHTTIYAMPINTQKTRARIEDTT